MINLHARNITVPSPAVAGLVMGGITGVGAWLISQSDAVAGTWFLAGAWVSYFSTWALASDTINRPVVEPVRPEPAAQIWAGGVYAQSTPVLVPTQPDGLAGHRFDVTPRQWSILAERVSHGQYGLPVNSLSVNGYPFGQKQIEQFRDDMIDAGLATKSPTGRVWMNEAGRVFVMLQSPSPSR
jgi:hypothetical protein